MKPGRILRIFLATYHLPAILGQRTEVTCNNTNLSWTFNSLGQNPCLVASYLQYPCSTEGSFDVPKLESDEHYDPPDDGPICACNSVVYSLLSACASCQEAVVGVWTEYSENCTKLPGDGEYTLAIPFGTAVPRWAYQKVTAANRFNVTLAKSVGDSPENVTSSPTTISSVSTSASSSMSSPTSSSSSSASTGALPDVTSAYSGKHKAGVIAGSVIGTLCGVALIGALLAYFLVFRKRKYGRTPGSPSATYLSGEVRPMSYNTGAASAGSTRTNNTATDPYRQSQPHLQQPQSSVQDSPAFQRPYNPDDPSTFPPTPRPGLGHPSDRIQVY